MVEPLVVAIALLVMMIALLLYVPHNPEVKPDGHRYSGDWLAACEARILAKREEYANEARKAREARLKDEREHRAVRIEEAAAARRLDGELDARRVDMSGTDPGAGSGTGVDKAPTPTP